MIALEGHERVENVDCFDRSVVGGLRRFSIHEDDAYTFCVPTFSTCNILALLSVITLRAVKRQTRRDARACINACVNVRRIQFPTKEPRAFDRFVLSISVHRPVEYRLLRCRLGANFKSDDRRPSCRRYEAR